jgi:hypothetical protein
MALPQLLQPLELRREAAFAGRVDDQQHLATVLVQLDRLAVDGLRLEIVNSAHVS